MLCIKCGMSTEATVARTYAVPGTFIIYGQQDAASLEAKVPKECKAILSFGLSGGLRRISPKVGDTVVASSLLVDGQGHFTYPTDAEWSFRLALATNSRVARYFSNGRFNEANTPAQRQALYQRTEAWCIDDESYFVAKFAEQRKIPYTIMRTVSDAWNDDVSVTANMLSPTGGVNVGSVLYGLFTQPLNMFSIWRNYSTSIEGLKRAAQLAGPTFHAP